MTEQKNEKINNRMEVARSAAGLTILSMLSPATGLAVEVALAWRLGASSTVDAFRIASLLVIFGWPLFVSEIIPYVIVPVFAECRARGAQNEGWTVAFSVANVFLIPTVVICALAALYPVRVVDLLGPGLIGAARAYAASFVRWFALAVIPLVWSGAAGSILYAHDIFWLPPVTSIFGNCMIFAALVVLPTDLAPMGLMVATVAASMCTLVIFGARLWPLMRGSGIKARSLLTLNMRPPTARKALGSCMPLLATVLTSLVAWAVLNRVLSAQRPGAVASFGYAWKMLAFVSLVPNALAVVMFPKFAQAHFASQQDGFRVICTKGLRMGLYMVIPLSAVCFVLRFPLTLVLFYRGAFSHEAAGVTSRFFGLLLLFVPAGVIYMYLQRISYAVHDTLTPSLMQCAAQVFFIGCAPLIGAQSGGDGLCLLLITTQWIACALLAHWLSRSHGALDFAGTAAFAAQLLLVSLVAAWAGARVAHYCLSTPDFSGMIALLFRTALTSGLIAAFFLLLTTVLRVPEASVWLRHVQTAAADIARLGSFRRSADL